MCVCVYVGPVICVQVVEDRVHRRLCDRYEHIAQKINHNLELHVEVYLHN